MDEWSPRRGYRGNHRDIEYRNKNDRHGKGQGIEPQNVNRYHESTRDGNKRGIDHLKTERSSSGLLLYSHYYWSFDNKHRENLLNCNMCLFFIACIV